MPLPDAVPIEAQPLSEDRVVHHGAQASRGGGLDSGDGIRDIQDESDGQELRAGPPFRFMSESFFERQAQNMGWPRAGATIEEHFHR